MNFVEGEKPKKNQVLAVMTQHQQYEKEKEEAITLTKEMTSQATTTLIGDLFDFADDVYIGDGKARKSRKARRQLKREYKKGTEGKNEDSSWIKEAKGKEELIGWQTADPTLDKIRAMVVQDRGDYEEHDGILY